MEPGRPKLVLVVEDDPMVRDLYGLTLREEGYRVEMAHDGIAAVGQIPYLKPDCIILDLMLPGFSGLEILDLLASTRSPARVMVITGAFTGSGLKEKILATPNVVGCLTKPVSPNQLRELLRAHLTGP